ncbi:MAG: 16S rRNA (cytidine(1402)-2'-O)-methyltransferase [Pikeienuella sp.]
MPDESKRSDVPAGQDPDRARTDPSALPPRGPSTLAPGLYFVATPIGHSGDITLRALDILQKADAIAAEDTRQTRKLMQIHGIPLGARPIVSYHDQNGAQRRPQILRWLAEGRAVAYCSDAGTPLLADPGYRLAAAAIADGHPVVAAPGASALLAGLSVAGLPTDRFFFAGFLPPKSAARLKALAELAQIPGTLVFYESPRRLGDALADMAACLGPRQAAVARELTKAHEEVRRGTLDHLADTYATAPPRGEIVIIVAPPDGGARVAEAEAALDTELAAALTRLTVKDAAREVAARLGLPKRQVYARALELSEEP